MQVFEKCANFTIARDLRAAGLYPYFQRIESSADTAVVIDGHRKIMVGSNNYMGLTHDPRIIEAAKEALDKVDPIIVQRQKLPGDLVEGKLAKWKKESCLLHQPSIMHEDKTIQTLLEELTAKLGEKLSIRRFTRYELGEGIEKKVDNFVEEVMAQVKGAS